MSLKYLLCLQILFWTHLAVAQDISIQKQMENIDSLINYRQLDMAERESNRVYTALSSNGSENENKELKLAVTLYKADILLLKEKYIQVLEIALTTIDQAKKFHLPKQEYKACLNAALVYEISEHFKLCKSYLDEAFVLYEENNLAECYSTYCIRSSSYYRLMGNRDSSLYYAYQGLYYAEQYTNKRDHVDAYLLLSILTSQTNYVESIIFASLAANEFIKMNDYFSVAAMHSNISQTYQVQKKYHEAFLHNDTAIQFSKQYAFSNELFSILLRNKYQLFEALGNKDSAYFYFKEYHDFKLKALNDQQATEILSVTEKYKNDKREVVIKTKNQELAFIIALLAVIVAAAILLIMKNRKIYTQNQVIRKQVEELTKTLEQKQLLLSELQHRVKNNLQHVISILELQKESVDFNNIEEIIRGNQNRIHSIALLHKKLNIMESVNEVYFRNYILELSELVKTSYESEYKKVSLNIICEVEKMSIEKALPLGLILVELVSNSMKHAFHNQNSGAIDISFRSDDVGSSRQLHYKDNGSGFNYNATIQKGLGLEIIKGLIDQLNASVKAQNKGGFELIVYLRG